MQVDRIRIFLLHGYATEVINMTWEWCANGTWSNNAPLQAMSTATFPWTMKQVHAGQQIIIPNVNHLPAEAGAEQAHFQAHELQSLVIIPLLNSRGVALGYIGFGDMHQRRNWTDELQSLNVFADMISATLERRCFIKRLQQGEQDMLKTQAMAHIGSWAVYPAKPENDTLSAEVFRMFNICRDEPMNYKSFLQRLHPDDKRHVLAAIRAALGGTPFINLCYRIIRSGGIVRHIQANGDVQCDPITNRVKSIYGTVQDITERVELEALDGAITQAQAASKAKGDFLAVMSHELRTPLHGIIGLQNLLAQDLTDLPSKQRERLALAQHSAHILSSLIDDILDLSKIESGSMVLQESTFNLQGLLHNAMLTFLATAQQKQIQLELVLDDVPEMVVGDAVRLRQVLLNIVGNAMKFTQQGGVRLYAHYRERSLDQEAGLLIDIRDNGIGMAAGDLAQLFQPFKQCGQRFTRQGTGLGTTIAMQFARMMGGDITVESEPDKGSIFHISLALGATGDVRINQQIEITSHTLSANAAPLPGVELHNLKLLLAEDDPIARLIAMENIRRIGLHVDVAENGLIAWKKVQNGDYDVLLTDIRMPGIDGIELTKKIRAHKHSKDDVRITIIGLSAHAMAHVADEAYAAGMDAFIAKPIESETLLHRLNAIMAYSDAAVMA